MTGSRAETRAAQRRAARAPAVSLVPPEARELQGTRAGVVSRVLASSVDFTVIAAVLGAGYLGVGALLFLWDSRSFSWPSPPFGLVLVIGSTLMAVYLAACWVRAGRTYGDYLLGLRVVSRRGGRLPLGVALLRAGLCVLVPIGLLWAGVNRSNRSLQDLALRTSVLYDWQSDHTATHPASRSDA
jgi:uncharacterized RDD family membrane protein YckC